MIGRLTQLFSGTGLKARALRGSALTFLTFGGGQLLRLISNLILTRLLFPEAFGLMALVQVFVTGLQMFSDIGLVSAIIQSKRGDDPVFLNTGWTMQVVRGAGLALVAVALAIPAAQFYDQPMLTQLLPVVAINALVNGFVSTKIASANRQLVLGRLTVLELSAQLVGILTMIALALVLKSVWALVIGTVVGTAFKVAMSHLYLPGPRNRLAFERPAFLELFHFGKYIFFSSICGFFINYGDRAILGKFVSLSDLAFYNIAFFFATVPLMLTHQFVQKIMLPLYREKPTRDSVQNRRAVSRARGLLTGAMIASALVLAIIGDGLVRFLYTPEYHMAAPLLVALALGSLPVLITTSYANLLVSQGNSRGFAIILLATAVLQTGFLILGAQQIGVLGAVFASGAAAICAYPLLVWLLRPYAAWDPRHDLGFAALSLVAGGLILWLKPDVYAQLLAFLPG